MNTYCKPRWWVLYLLYAVMLALLFAQAPLPIAVGWHKFMEIVITSVMLGLMAVWMRRNARVLDDEAVLRDIARRTGRRHAALTPIQARYLLAQQHQIERHSHDI